MKKITIIFTISIFSQLLFAQSTFEKRYGTAYNDDAVGCVEVFGVGYAVVGTKGTSIGDSDIFLLMLDENGDSLWMKTYGGSGNDVATSIIQTTDGGFAISGYTNSYGSGGDDAYLIKTDASGNVSWEKQYGGTDNNQAFSVIQTSDEGYALAGITEGTALVQWKAYLIKTDNNGNLSWSNSYSPNNYNYAYSLLETSDNGYLIAGSSGSLTNKDVYILKTLSNGNIDWQKYYGSADIDEGRSIAKSSDGYIVAGYIKSTGVGNNDIYALSLNSSGDTLWTKKIGGTNTDEAYKAFQNTSGNYIIVGFVETGMTVNQDLYITMLNSTGTQIWEKTYGGASDDIAKFAIENNSGGIIVAGITNSFLAINEDAYVLNLDVNACVFPNISITGELEFCENATTLLTTEVDNVLSDFGIEWQNNSTINNILINQSEDVYVVATLTNGCEGSSDTLFAAEVPNPVITLEASPAFNVCMNTPVSLNAVISNLDSAYTYSYSWSSGDSSPEISLSYDGAFNLTVTNVSIGCEAETNFDINYTIPYADEKICITTVDTTLGKNLIVWDKTSDAGIESYNIYREIAATGMYELIANVPFDTISVFVDPDANPLLDAFRYKISVIDTCGNESALSDAHKTIHLEVNNNLFGGIDLSWNQSEGFGFTFYRIFRGTSPDNLQPLTFLGYTPGTILQNDPVSNIGTYYYRVVALKLDTCYVNMSGKTQLGPYSQSISNLDDNRIDTGIDNITEMNDKISISPNPINDRAVISFTDTKKSIEEVEVYNSLGQMVVSYKNVNSKLFVLNRNNLESGVYFIKVKSKYSYWEKCIIE